MTLRCVHSYRMFRFGDVLQEECKRVSEDHLNYYVHGVNDDNGYSQSNFLTLPKYAFVREEA